VRRGIALRYIIAVLLLICAAPVSATELPPNPFVEEAPESLFDLSVGDADVSFFASGEWSTGIGLGLTGAFGRSDTGERAVYPNYAFPGIAAVPFFNRVGLTLSLWILQRYFLEASVSDDLSSSSFLLGYMGMPGDFVQSILIGNSGIDIGAYPYLGFGDATGVIGQEAPGAVAAFQTERSDHELMVRFSPSRIETLRYAYGGIVNETSVAASDYRRGRHFVLPDGGLTTLSVYVADPDGSLSGSDGLRYRVAAPGVDMVVSLADGTVSLASAPDTRVVVYYEVQETPIGDATLGNGAFFALTDGVPDPAAPRDFSFASIDDLLALYPGDPVRGDDNPAASDFIVTIGAHTGLVIYDPARYSAFERSAFYDLATGPASTCVIRTRAGAEITGPFTVIADSSGITVRLADPLLSPRAFVNRYPLASIGELFSSLYGPVPESTGSPLIVARSVTRTETIRLPADYVPGSVVVRKNGVNLRAFTVADSGELELEDPIAPTDLIDVTYRVANSQGPGDLLFGAGNRFYFGGGFRADLAAAMRWKPVGARYSTVPGEYPGYLTLSGSLGFDLADRDDEVTDRLTATLSGALGYSVHDTSGALRAAGMNMSAGVIPVTESGLFPGAPPALDPDTGDAVSGFTPAERGILRFVDYSTTDALGNRSLLPYTTDLPGSASFPYEPDGRRGPYAALSVDSGQEGTVAVLDYTIPAGANWVAAQLRMPETPDLSHVSELRVAHRTLADGDPVRVFLQIGAVSEDGDGDGVTDDGIGMIPFTDVASGFDLGSGPLTEPTRLWSEDADSNGILDTEIADQVLSRELTASLIADGWVTDTIALTQEERRLLSSSRAARILIQRADLGSEPEGIMIFSRITLVGTAFRVDTPDGVDVEAREINEELLIAESGGQTLGSAFPEVEARFVGTGESNRVLSVRWTDLGTDSVVLTRYIEPLDASAYATLRLYYRSVSPSPNGTLTLAVHDATDTSIATVAVPLDSLEWQEAILELPEDVVTVIGTVTVTIEDSTPGAREIAIDELVFQDPRSAVGAVGELTFLYAPQATIEIGGRTVVSDITVQQTLSARTEGFTSTGVPAGIGSDTRLSATVLGVAIKAGVAAQASSGGNGLLVDHSLMVPLFDHRLALADSYSRSFGVLGDREVHSAEVELRPWDLLSGRFGWRTISDGSEEDVSWEADTALSSASISWNASADLAATHTAGERETYPRSYFTSFGALVPVTGDAAVRATTLSTGMRITGETLGFAADAEIGSRSSAATILADTSVLLDYDLPVQLGDTRITLSGSRVFTSREARLPEPSVGAEIASTWSAGASPLWYATIPFYELIDPDLEADFATETSPFVEATYTPAVTLTVGRQIRSTVAALLLPTDCSVSVSRPLTRFLDSISGAHEFATRATFIAPNLFGALGTSSVFGWYDTDEYATSISASATLADSGWTGEIDVDQRTRFLWTDGRNLSIRSTAAFDLGSGTTGRVASEASYEWKSSARRLLEWERLQRLEEHDPYFRHGETLALLYTRKDEERLTFRARHDTAFVIPERGEVSLYAGLGVGYEWGLMGLFLAGFELGITGRLQL
jgi:hypothetical protein